MSTIVGSQRLTLFQDDDFTPILGTVDGSGNVTEPTCSTNPQYLRPFMKQIMEQAQATIDFKNGSSVIGQMTADIVDKRRTATDQSTGWFTNILAASGTQNTQLIGRRCLVEQQASDGSWYVLLDGVVYSVALDKTFVVYRLTIRDIRERERSKRVFVASGHSILPWGPAQGFGQIQIADASGATTGQFNYVMPPVGGVKATYDSAKKQFILATGINSDDVYWALLGPFMYGIMQQGPSGNYAPYLSTVEVRWAVWNDSYQYYSNPQPAYTAIDDMTIGALPLFVATNTGDRVRGFRRTITGINIDPTAGTFPANGTVVWLQVASADLPTSDTPLYLSINFGQLLKNLYDGVYSDPGAPLIRYNAAAMTAFIAATPQANMILSGVVADRRTWIEENIYKPLGYAPALNTKGEVVPIKYSLPDATVSLAQLDDTNVAEMDWQHDSSEIVTKVVFTYQRDYGFDGVIGDASLLTIKSRDVIVERISADTTIFGEQVLEYKPETVRSASNQADGSAFNGPGNVVSEVGFQLATARGLDAINRFSQGAQSMTGKLLRAGSGVAALQVGDWVIVACSWLPDYISGVRGINRLAQIIMLQDLDPIHRSVTLLDAGAQAQPLTNATVTSIAANNTTNCIDATITVIPAVAGVTVKVEMQYTLATTQPITGEDGKWVHMIDTTVTGAVHSMPLPQSVTAWVRYRTVAEGRRPSAWSVPVSVIFTMLPQLKDVSLTMDPKTGRGTVNWRGYAGAAGVRIYYAVTAYGVAPATSLTSGTFIDVDATLGGKLLSTIVVPTNSTLSVQTVPYAVFSGGNCSGTAGTPGRVISAVNNASGAQFAVELTQISQTATTVTFDVTVKDGLQQLTSATVDVSWLGLSSLHDDTGGVTVPVGGETYTATIGTSRRFTVTLSPAFRGGGYVKFKASAADRVDTYATWFSAQADGVANPGVVISIGNNQSATDPTAKALATINAPSNITDIKWLASTSSYPTQAAVVSGGATVSGGSPFTIADLGVSLSLGDTVYLTAITLDAFGNITGLFYQAKATRESIHAQKTYRYTAGSWNKYLNFAATNEVVLGALEPFQRIASPLTGGGECAFIINFVIPDNCEITKAMVGMYDNEVGANGVVVFAMYRSPNIALAGISSTPSTGWADYPYVISELTTSRRYLATMIIDAAPASTSNQSFAFSYLDITFIAADTQASL